MVIRIPIPMLEEFEISKCINKHEHTKCCGIMYGNEATMFLPASFLNNGVEFRVLWVQSHTNENV